MGHGNFNPDIEDDKKNASPTDANMATAVEQGVDDILNGNVTPIQDGQRLDGTLSIDDPRRTETVTVKELMDFLSTKDPNGVIFTSDEEYEYGKKYGILPIKKVIESGDSVIFFI